MFPTMIKTCSWSLLIVSLIHFAHGQDRKITSVNHPGCYTCTDDDTLIYTTAKGPHDTIHQIWDFTGGAPTVILTVASVNSTVTIQWEGNMPRRFTISETPKYSFAAVIDMIYEYNDIEDNGYIDGHSEQRAVPLARVSWRLADDVRTEEEVMVRLLGAVSRGHVRGDLEVRLDLLPFKDYAVDLPHLIHTANSTLLDVSLVNLTSSPQFNSSRFALHMVLVSADPANDTMHYDMRKSLDDEHTPGIFEIVEIKSPESLSRGDGGFLQFRPVAYTRRARGVTSSTRVHVSNFNRTDIRSSTLASFFRAFDRQKLLVQDVFISFGEAGDGFYKKHGYMSWSLTIGYGAPPLEGFSTFVLAVICAGLGAPLLLAGAGAAYALLRRRAHAAPAPRRFSNDQ